METSAIAMFRNTIQYQDNLIWVKPVCEFFNLSVQSEYRKIKKDPILGNLWTKSSTDFEKKADFDAKTSTEIEENSNGLDKKRPELGVIDANGRILLSRKGFIRWIQIINSNSVEEGLREKFITYQDLVFDFLYGNVEEDKATQVHYARLQKLERLQGKISSEIKKEKRHLQDYLQHKFQLAINFKGPYYDD